VSIVGAAARDRAVAGGGGGGVVSRRVVSRCAVSLGGRSAGDGAICPLRAHPASGSSAAINSCAAPRRDVIGNVTGPLL
jgi:hypothetical protein